MKFQFAADRFPNQMAAIVVIFGVLEGERVNCRRGTMKPGHIAWVEKAVNSLQHQRFSMGWMQAVAA